MRPSPKPKAAAFRQARGSFRDTTGSPRLRRSLTPTSRSRGASPSRKSEKAQVLAAFEAFDSNGDGAIERWELHQLLNRLAQAPLSEADLDRMFDVADCNRDGKIHIQEFIDFVWYEETRVGKSDFMGLAAAAAAPGAPGEASAAAKAGGPPQVPPELSVPDLVQRDRSAIGLDAVKLQKLMDEVVAHVCQSTGADSSTAILLLIHAKWDSELVIKNFAQDAGALLTAAGASSACPAQRGQPCSVCFMEEAVSCLPCGHGLCAEDWPGFLKSNLDSGTVDGENCTRLRCAGAHCPLMVPPDRFEKFLGAEDYRRYSGLLLLSFTNDGSNVRQCPAVGCDLYVVSRSRKPAATCKCGHSFCFSCGLPPHAPVRCAEARQWLTLCETPQSEYEKETRSADTKNCPNPDCNVPTYKVDGCHHIACPMCRVNWCWMCGAWGGGSSGRPQPHHVFECNDEISAEWSSNRSSIGVFRRRYENHLSSLEIISRQGDSLIDDLGGAGRLKGGDRRLVSDAIKLLVDCRRHLAWTYAQCYLETDRSAIWRIKNGQNDFERQVEQFNSLLSSDWIRASADEHEIDDLAASILEGRMQQLRDILNGMNSARPA